MTVTAPPPPATSDPAAVPTSGSAAVSPTARGLWRGARGAVALGVIVLAVAVVTALIVGGSGESGRLDPTDTTLSGGKALARLLAGQGVRVERVSTVEEVERLDGTESQLLVSGTWWLTSDEHRRLARTRADRLVVGADPALPTLAPGLETTGEASPRSREPACELPAAVRAGSAYMGGVTFRTPPGGAVGCYPGAEGVSLVRVFGSGAPTVTVVGDGAFMTNQRLAEDGNAALAVNLAGTKPVLIWLVPGDRPASAPGSGNASPGDLIPAGVVWALVQLLVAVLVVALWRGRRLGPVVVERLPVVVRAAETVEGRGRLYRARRARDRAAATLRAACAARLTPRLGLTGDATPEEIVAATALKSGQDAAWVRSVMYGPVPADDAALVALAGQLDTLERQVRES
ncbi:hypothetical protein Ssi03_07480 [Sphaerisporangium siamense]|uniref:DUF4350 domain-containing protein n=1 Tax=Sphaerisporangium siamense TaxID=795645 RepID=A0A7W7GEX8_9ACTN|nr:DUF4350 domain-containing protein [Sphaerisporangium siamense]MBB4705849.1 hypothetical protein [Sphaerisporangium siamense]GII82758.1 hypothetical protein Ssi03_07480 [Sphaerisporangium siamense]